MLTEPNIDPEKQVQIMKSIDHNEKQIESLYLTILDRYLGNIDDIKKSYAEYKSDQAKRNSIINLLEKEERHQAAARIKKYIYEDDKHFTKIMAFADNKAKDFYNESVLIKKQVELLSFIGIGSTLIVILSGFLYFYKNISNTEKQLIKRKDELKESNIRLNLAQDAAGFGIWDIDLLTGDLKWDKQMYQLYGIDPSDFSGQVNSWVNRLHPEDVASTFSAYEKALRGENEYHLIFRIIRPDGNIRYLQGDGIVLLSEKGKALRMVGINYDITDLIESKEQLRKRDVQMMQQSRLAQMGEMISMIAHQWRQPLAAIAATTINLKIGFQLDSNQLTDDDKRDQYIAVLMEELEKIEDFVCTLTNTIDDFRSFYKPDREMGMVKVYSPIKKALNIVGNSLESEGITLEVSCSKTLNIPIFEKEIVQVILNILKNAQDNFRDRGIESGIIMIECHEAAKYVTITVVDNGGGIAEDIIDNVFDPYFTTKEEKNGTGLGLYMSKIIIEEHHQGKLTVENREDGCCFTIMLPMHKE